MKKYVIRIIGVAALCAVLGASYVWLRNDATVPQFTQVAILQPSSNNATTSTLTDFSTNADFTVTAPLTNNTGDTLVVDINSTLDGICLYLRQPADSTPSGGTNAFDTYMFSGLGDSMITVLAGTLTKLRIGDTAGRVYDDDKISESGVVVRVRLQLTPAFLNACVNVGIGTSALSIYKARGATLSVDNDFSEVGATYTKSDLDDGNGFTLTSNPISSFSWILVAPGGPAVSAGGGGICVIGRCVDTRSPVAFGIRQMRDAMMSTRPGRILTSMYYRLK